MSVIKLILINGLVLGKTGSVTQRLPIFLTVLFKIVSNRIYSTKIKLIPSTS